MIGLVDYGMGNLHSVSKALALQNVRVLVSDDARRLDKCSAIVVPGVGSFGAAMRNLKAKKLASFLKGWVNDGRPYLGICLGLQLLFERSEEDASEKGLGVLPGRVLKFRPSDFTGKDWQIPHMGWNEASQKSGSDRRYFNGLKPSDRFYFVHSYYAAPADKNVICTTTRYGKNFCSSVQTGSLFASQFHLEKSGDKGLRLLKNAVQLLNEAA